MMSGNSYDRDLAKIGIENTKKKQKLKRARERDRDGWSTPVNPGLVGASEDRVLGPPRY